MRNAIEWLNATVGQVHPMVVLGIIMMAALLAEMVTK